MAKKNDNESWLKRKTVNLVKRKTKNLVRKSVFLGSYDPVQNTAENAVKNAARGLKELKTPIKDVFRDYSGSITRKYTDKAFAVRDAPKDGFKSERKQAKFEKRVEKHAKAGDKFKVREGKMNIRTDRNVKLYEKRELDLSVKNRLKKLNRDQMKTNFKNRLDPRVANKDKLKGALAFKTMFKTPTKFYAKTMHQSLHSAIRSGSNEVAGMATAQKIEQKLERGATRVTKGTAKVIRNRHVYLERRQIRKLDKKAMKRDKAAFKANKASIKGDKALSWKEKRAELKKNRQAFRKHKIKKQQMMQSRFAAKGKLTSRMKERLAILQKLSMRKRLKQKIKRTLMRLFIPVFVVALIFLIFFAFFSACSVIGGNSSGVAVTTYTAAPEAMESAEKYFSGKEAGLVVTAKKTLDSIQTAPDGTPLSGKVLQMPDIGHYTHELQAWLNVRHKEYKFIHEYNDMGTPASSMDELFSKMYSIQVEYRYWEEREKIRVPTENGWEIEEGELVRHCLAIIKVVKNFEIKEYAEEDIKKIMEEDPKENDERLDHFKGMLGAEGNMPELFEGIKYSTPLVTMMLLDENGAAHPVTVATYDGKPIEVIPGDGNIPPINGFYGEGGGYALNNCTAYAYNRFKDWGGSIPGGMGHAYMWAENARAKGYTVDTRCTAGSIIVLPQNWRSPSGTYHTAEYGHVAIVEKVNADGSVVVSDMNGFAAGPHAQGVITMAPGELTGAQFIHP